VTRPPNLTEAELAAISDPAVLLDRAYELEPWVGYEERDATLDRLQAVIDGGAAAPPPPGRDWRLELLAERAIDAGRRRELDDAHRLVAQVVGEADATHQVALGRAMLAGGQAYAWIGTDESIRQSHLAFADAAERFAAMGNREWLGSALLRRGYSACYQAGDFLGAEALIREALETYEPESQRIAGALVPYSDVLIDLGRFDQAEQILDRAALTAGLGDTEKVRSEVTMGRARIATGRDDARAAERLLREAVREADGEGWFETHIGMAFVIEAAELLDRLGLREQANAYFEQAAERWGEANEEVLQAKAVLQARSGNPEDALESLQEVVRGDWLEKRVIWRHYLLTAWATFRAGRSGAGELAARALLQAHQCGTVQIAVAGEPHVVAALAPAAERGGSALARELLLAGRPQLPPGKPGSWCGCSPFTSTVFRLKWSWRSSSLRSHLRSRARAYGRCSRACGRPRATYWCVTAKLCGCCRRGSTFGSFLRSAGACVACRHRARCSSRTPRWRCMTARCCPRTPTPAGRRGSVTRSDTATLNCLTWSLLTPQRAARTRRH